ncbi:MAG TPA: hypothetical protein VM242_09200, partial [Acidimicrobiales bacterium]|nr:hypothetical protein [Acidimicrobiales bacterium]
MPLPSGGTTPTRRGTVLERSCGRSNALRIRWDAENGRPSREAWLADAAWHWSNSSLRVLSSRAATEVPVEAPGAVEVAGSEELWLSGSPRATTARTAVGPGTGAAFDEWEAALVAQTAPVDETSWEHLLAGALGIAADAGAVAADAGPAAPPLSPVTAVRLTAPSPAASAVPAAAPRR